jgi:hypothetical protein
LLAGDHCLHSHRLDIHPRNVSSDEIPLAVNGACLRIVHAPAELGAGRQLSQAVQRHRAETEPVAWIEEDAMRKGVDLKIIILCRGSDDGDVSGRRDAVPLPDAGSGDSFWILPLFSLHRQIPDVVQAAQGRFIQAPDKVHIWNDHPIFVKGDSP